MEITEQNVSYSQMRNGYTPVCDRYGIVSYQKESRTRIMLSNPNLENDEQTCLFLKMADGEPVGRAYYFPTRLKLGDDVVTALCSSSLEVHKDFRHLAIGADIVVNSSIEGPYHQRLFAGISAMALPLYKKMRFRVFPISQYFLRYRPVAIMMSRLGLYGRLY